MINHAAGQKDYPFAGWLIQNDLSNKLTLGGEIFGRDKDTDGGRAATLLNAGGYYRFTPDFNLLFSAGRSVAGETHTVGYLGLWWTWGANETTEKTAGVAPAQSGWSLADRQW